MYNLVLYYRSTCGYCQKVLRFISDHNIEITKKDIGESPQVRRELVAIGGKSQVPCLMIDGKALYESDDVIQWLDRNMKAS